MLWHLDTAQTGLRFLPLTLLFVALGALAIVMNKRDQAEDAVRGH
jgi:hypothetical protein